jgi:hypothetical protein
MSTYSKRNRAMYFEYAVEIRRKPDDVFAFLRDKEKTPQKSSSRVLVMEKTTGGKTGVGTGYREVVQMLPFFRGEILSEITLYEEGRILEEDFKGAGMKGHLAYQFIPKGEGTQLIQRENLEIEGIFKIASPLIRNMLFPRLKERLIGIKSYLENEDRGARQAH